jgi:hypothetical protein
MRSCALHFGRSREYGQFKASTPRVPRQPTEGREFCAEYECDKPRPWLLSMEMTGVLEAAVAAVGALPKVRA